MDFQKIPMPCETEIPSLFNTNFFQFVYIGST